MRPQRVRIGIDVGGTFTHAVALDADTLELVGKTRVPTTHSATEGVARGVITSLEALLRNCALKPEQVVLIAHSTTQATNALLEGDVAPVGIVGMGGGGSAWLARRQTAIRPIRLAPGRFLTIHQRFIRSERVSEQTVNQALDDLVRAGAQVIVAAEAFAVDDPRREELVCELAARRGLPATATHQVSRLHGLGIRTRTAVINASMLPRMLSTAEMTDRAVKATGLTAPLMIMRSDGGLMNIEEMRRRPILTMLSGPAAGVAAALLYARVTDGLFLEVGGTSTDISVIKGGRCQIRSAAVGGQNLHVRTLDVRTIGLAGGSLVYLRDGRIAQVGPRSAHIAGLSYLSFTDRPPHSFTAATCRHEHEEYLAVEAQGEKLAVTPTCASNRLGLVPAGDPAEGRRDRIDPAFDRLAAHCGMTDGGQLAEAIMQQAARVVIPVLEALIAASRLDRDLVRLVGGGGGASAVVPYVARKLNLPYETVANADVISAIGVALALVRDTVERTVIAPTDDDIRRIREEARHSVLRMGAAADTVEVFVEVDAKRNLLRATAEGATEIRRQELRRREPNDAERRELVVTSLGAGATSPEVVATAAGFEVWSARRVVRRLWGLISEPRRAVRVLDRAGTIRWASNHADARISTVATAERDLEALAESHTSYSDAGAIIPRCYVLLDGRIVDLSGLAELKQVLGVLRMELQRHPSSAECVLLVNLAPD